VVSASRPMSSEVARASLPVPPATPAPSAHQATPPPRSESRPPADSSPHNPSNQPRPTPPRPLPPNPNRHARQQTTPISNLLAQAGNSTTLLNRPHEHWP
jgi:hypothetical protein